MHGFEIQLKPVKKLKNGKFRKKGTKLEFSAVLTDMKVYRSKNRGNICKANTVGDATGNFLKFSYEITFRYPNIAPSF